MTNKEMNNKGLATWTVGPWLVHYTMGNGDFHWIVPADLPDVRIAKVEAYAPALTIDCDNDMEAEGLANARLIASAPSLYEALETFEQQWNACGPNSDFGRYFQRIRDAAVSALAEANADHWLNRSRAALAKVTPS